MFCWLVAVVAVVMVAPVVEVPVGTFTLRTLTCLRGTLTL
jgi:hypothetical protein